MVTVRWNAAAVRPNLPSRAASKPTWLRADGQTYGVRLTWMPREVTHDALAATWSETPRPGRAGMLSLGGRPLRTVSFTARVGSLIAEGNAETDLNKLRQMAQSGRRVRLIYGALEGGWWTITALSITSTERSSQNRISRADVAITLTEYVTAPPKIGRATGGGRAKSRWRTVTYKRGHSLYGLARKYLGNGNRWKEIAKANKIKNPKKIKVGTRLRIPPK